MTKNLSENIALIDGHLSDDELKTRSSSEECTLGYAVLINVEKYDLPGNDRLGSSKEMQLLGQVLTKYNYEVHMYRDPTKMDLEGLLQRIKDQDLQKYGSLIFVISCHGNKDGVYASDATTSNTYVDYDKFITALDDNKTLAEKFKWITFACCRGSQTNYGFFSGNNCQSRISALGSGFIAIDEDHLKIPKFSDAVILYATQLGYLANRCPLTGTILLRNLRYHLEEVQSGHSVQLLDLLTQVNESVSLFPNDPGRKLGNTAADQDYDENLGTVKQMSEFTSRLRRHYDLFKRDRLHPSATLTEETFPELKLEERRNELVSRLEHVKLTEQDLKSQLDVVSGKLANASKP